MANLLPPDTIARAGILALAMSENKVGHSEAELYALAGDLHRSLNAGVAGKIGHQAKDAMGKMVRRTKKSATVFQLQKLRDKKSRFVQ
jgi:hypothetical protein